MKTKEELENLICEKLGMWTNPSIESLAEELFNDQQRTLKLSESKQQLPVVKEPDGWLVHNMFNENKLILERYLTDYDINPNELKPVYFSPQVSPSDEEKCTHPDNECMEDRDGYKYCKKCASYVD